MKATLLVNERGIVLLITLAVITVLVASVLALNRKMRSVVGSSAAARDRIIVSSMATSGIHAAMAMLVKDKSDSETDSLQEDWAGAEKIAELLTDLPFEEGKITFTITDEMGKIQVNALVAFPQGREFNEPQRQLWERFLEPFFSQNDVLGSESDPAQVINSLKDWLDSGDDDAITGISGAESDHYQTLEPPYSCRNGPIHHLNELLLVQGITDQLFFGNEAAPGISAYLTVNGAVEAENNSFTYGGKININTADMPVIAALLPPEKAELAEAIYNYRQETSDAASLHDLSKQTWYKNVPGCSDIDIDADLITTSSDLFSIRCTAVRRMMALTTTTVVMREKSKETGKWICKVLRWETK